MQIKTWSIYASISMIEEVKIAIQGLPLLYDYYIQWNNKKNTVDDNCTQQFIFLQYFLQHCHLTHILKMWHIYHVHFICNNFKILNGQNISKKIAFPHSGVFILFGCGVGWMEVSLLLSIKLKNSCLWFFNLNCVQQSSTISHWKSLEKLPLKNCP